MATDVNEARLEGLVQTAPNFREGEKVDVIDFVLRTEIPYGDRDPTVATHLVRGWDTLAQYLDREQLRPGDRIAITGRLGASKDGDTWITRIVLDQHFGEFEVIKRGDGEVPGAREGSRAGRGNGGRSRGGGSGDSERGGARARGGRGAGRGEADRDRQADGDRDRREDGDRSGGDRDSRGDSRGGGQRYANGSGGRSRREERPRN